MATNTYNTMSPYDHPISEDTAHDTFVHVGSDETISQSVFLNRADRLDDVRVLAYDATTVPGNIPDVIAVENATKQLKVLGLEHAEV